MKAQFDANGFPSVLLDGDDLRVIFGDAYLAEHFTKEYRDTNTRQLQRFAEHLEAQGINVIISTVNSVRSVREELKSRNKRVYEIYVINSGPHVRENLKRADFEEPLNDFIIVDTNGLEPADALRIVWNKI